MFLFLSGNFPTKLVMVHIILLFGRRLMDFDAFSMHDRHGISFDCFSFSVCAEKTTCTLHSVACSLPYVFSCIQAHSFNEFDDICLIYGGSPSGSVRCMKGGDCTSNFTGRLDDAMISRCMGTENPVLAENILLCLLPRTVLLYKWFPSFAATRKRSLRGRVIDTSE